MGAHLGADLNMDSRQHDILSTFFTDQSPLGDIAALEIANEESKIVFQAYFDSENQPIQELRREPSIIVGRKGSGKTDALLSYHLGVPKGRPKYFPIVYFEATSASRSFSNVINQITDAIQDNFPPPTVESVSEFWSSLFWITILSSIATSATDDNSDEFKIISSFVSEIVDGRVKSSNPYNVLICAIMKMRNSYLLSEFHESKVGLFNCQDMIQFSGINISDAKVVAISWLKKNRYRAIVLFDSIESTDLAEIHNQLVISGLLKCVGSFQSPGNNVQIRCCIPAESYFRLMEMSSNVLKDFRNMNMLHWHAREILRICAIRYYTYLTINSPQTAAFYRKKYNSFSTRDDTIDFWNEVLPEFVPNYRSGTNERTLPYIIRHTQLLPRHFITIFNDILSTSQQCSKSKDLKISSEIVVRCVRDSEAKIVYQILDSFKTIWPDADLAMKSVFPRLNRNIISYSMLHNLYNTSGVEKGKFRNVDGYSDFLRMLCEVGAIGRLVTRTEDYATANFEYSEPHKMILTYLDYLCIHPIFTEFYSVINIGRLPDDYLPIYPLGTDPRAPDHRIF